MHNGCFKYKLNSKVFGNVYIKDTGEIYFGVMCGYSLKTVIELNIILSLWNTGGCERYVRWNENKIENIVFLDI